MQTASYGFGGPTPYPDVNAVLELLLQEVRAILGDELVGMYLYGSLSSGDFDPGSSDVDFLVVTARELDEPALHALAATHARIARSGLAWATKLEGSYMPAQALRRYDATNNRHASIGADWEFGVYEHGLEWVIQRHIVREQGVVVWGPPPATLIDPVTPEELRQATRANLRCFWAQQLDGPAWLHPRNYQAFAILTMCRALYTLQHGAIVSKKVAAAWASGWLEPTRAALVERALRWQYDEQPGDIQETLDFVRWTLDRAEQL